MAFVSAVTAAAFMQLACACSHASLWYGKEPLKRMSMTGTALKVLDPLQPAQGHLTIHARGNKAQEGFCGTGSLDRASEFGFVSIDEDGTVYEGMNEKGLTISTLSLRKSRYQEPRGANDLCWTVVPFFALGFFENALEFAQQLSNMQVIGAPKDDGFLFHWAVQDRFSNSIVIEYIKGELFTHRDDVGVLTNDPDYAWHVENLNNYVGVGPFFPQQSKKVQVETQGRLVPSTLNSGANGHGIPGDFTPASRFVRLFFMKQNLGARKRPKDVSEAVAASGSLLSVVWEPFGSVASPDEKGDDTDKMDASMYDTLRFPVENLFMYRDYNNPQFRSVNLNKIDFTPGVEYEPLPIPGGKPSYETIVPTRLQRGRATSSARSSTTATEATSQIQRAEFLSSGSMRRVQRN